MNIVEYSKYTLTLLFLLLFYLVYLTLKPFLLTVISAIILAYIFFPLYKLLQKYVIKNRYVCSFGVLILIFLMVSVPLFFVINALADQGRETYTLVRQYVSDPALFDCTQSSSGFCAVVTSFFSPEDSQLIQNYLQKSALTIGQTAAAKMYALLVSLPGKLTDFLIMIFLLFFLFVDGHKLLALVRELLPMKLEHESYILKTLKETTDAIVFGQTVTAVLQGVIAGIGFWLFGVPHAVLLGTVVAFLAIIPFVGSTSVWVPIAAYFIITGINTDTGSLVLKGVLLILYGALFISTIDTFLKPKIIGDKAKLHPAVVLLGVIAGVTFFGAFGFFLGPIIFGAFFSMITIYKKEKQLQLSKKGG
jgi:predicted PurR-regulated permease PerM